MSILYILLIAVALSVDAMAVSAASGAKYNTLSMKRALLMAFLFGFFQAGMPLIGWIIGTELEKFISNIDHWIAFVLLAIVGIRMLVEAFKSNGDEEIHVEKISYLFMLAIATSIDALVIGMTFAFTAVSPWLAIIIIGITTFLLSFISIYIGKKFGKLWGKKAEIAGGIILILIGLKILLDHLF